MKRKSKSLLIILIIVLSVIVVGLGGYLLIRHLSQNPSSGPGGSPVGGGIKSSVTVEVPLTRFFYDTTVHFYVNGVLKETKKVDAAVRETVSYVVNGTINSENVQVRAKADDGKTTVTFDYEIDFRAKTCTLLHEDVQ